MEILLGLSMMIGLYALVVARNAHKRLERHKKLSVLAESVLWDTLLEKEVIDRATYQDALDRFHRDVDSAT